MRVGATIFNQNYNDWDRYEAEEKGQSVAKRPAQSDREIFNEELNIARIADETGFDAVWTIEHHFTPYTMVTNPLQYLTYIAGITKRVDLGTMVVVLPWHNPVRVAEDVNMLDAFLGTQAQRHPGRRPRTRSARVCRPRHRSERGARPLRRIVEGAQATPVHRASATLTASSTRFTDCVCGLSRKRI